MATSSAGSTTPLFSYTVAPHLQAEFDVPLSAFAAAHADISHFVVGGFIFSERTTAPLPPPSSTSTSSKPKPKVLLLQRALSDSYGGRWDFPGGSVDNDTDASILDGLAREVFEETGYHVSHIRELVRVDSWTRLKKDRSGSWTVGPAMVTMTVTVAKYSFIVDVYESLSTNTATAALKEATGTDGNVETGMTVWEDQVILAPAEHQRFLWTTEEEVETSVVNKRNGHGEDGPYNFVGVQGETVLLSFRTYRGLTRN